MAEDFQNLGPKRPHQQPLYFGAERVPLTTDAPRIGDSHLQSSSLWTYLSPFHDQTTTTYVSVPGVMRSHWEGRWGEVTSETTGLMSGPTPEANSEMAPSPDWPDGNSWGGSTVLADGQLYVKGLSPDQVSECWRRKCKPADVEDIRITRAKVVILYMASEATPSTRVANCHSLRGTAPSYSFPSCPTASSTATYHYSRLNTGQGLPRYRRYSNTMLPLSRKVSQK